MFFSGNPVEDSNAYIEHLDNLSHNEEEHYCVIEQKPFKESEMIFIESQRDWVLVENVKEYLEAIYANESLRIYDTVKLEVEKLLLIRKNNP